MNKQELIKKYELKERNVFPYCPNRNSSLEHFKKEAYKEIVNDLKQFDEPQKVKVPAFVAEWIIQHCSMGKYVCLERFMCQYNSVELPTELYNYYDNNKDGARDKVISAILDDYEVEEEPKYYLDLPKMGMVNEISNSQLCWTNCDGGITEKQIKAIDERYWPFAVPVEKV